MSESPLAHSAPTPDARPQTYAAHLLGTQDSEGVVAGARRRAEAMLAFHPDPSQREAIARSIGDAAIFHDLGKLDPDLQKALARGRGKRLDWDHIDAGVAHLRNCHANMAAWIVRAHHAPGLPSLPLHFADENSRRLRGQRRNGVDSKEHQRQICRTDRLLPDMLKTHAAVIGPFIGPCLPEKNATLHGLPLRLALSCLVDADHADSAQADSGWREPRAAEPRWSERLAALDAYVERLGAGLGSGIGTGLDAESGDRDRNQLRRQFYDACRNRQPDQAIMACEGPVGIGKTTAVLAYALKRALASGARRLFIVAPYTAILSQTAEILRKALLLDDEQACADLVVAEHHHRADFSNASSRDLAALWNAPIVLTTAVQFFETLSANAPSNLRKLHALPGSVVILDEANAALPTPLWCQNWQWLRDLATGWGCSLVFASGSLARFWDVEDIVGEGETTCLPDLVPEDLAPLFRKAEQRRISYVTEGRLDGPRALIERVVATPGPRLVIMNTVQSAAALARLMRNSGHDVLHLSTALTPRDRDRILATIKARLGSERGGDWTLIATSLMESGVDLSFRTVFRERFSVAALIQIGGRANRNGEWSEGATVHDFIISHVDGLKKHPAAENSDHAVKHFFNKGKFSGQIDAAKLVTDAMKLEMSNGGSAGEANALAMAEQAHDYPKVAECGRVIRSDTRIVVIDPELRERIIRRETVTTRDLLAGSVQIWANNIARLDLTPLPGRADIYDWPHAYEADFIGYMAGILDVREITEDEDTVIIS